MAVYKFAPGFSKKGGSAKAQEVGETLEHIERRHGAVTPDVVVVAARNPDSPMHPYFTWDDEEAADKRRLDEARELIRSVVVVVIVRDSEGKEQQRTARAFVTLRQRGRRETEPYYTTARVMSNTEMREEFLAIALSEAQSWMRRYQEFVELAAVFRAIQRTSRKLGTQPKKKKPKSK